MDNSISSIGSPVANTEIQKLVILTGFWKGVPYVAEGNISFREDIFYGRGRLAFWGSSLIFK